MYWKRKGKERMMGWGIGRIGLVGLGLAICGVAGCGQKTEKPAREIVWAADVPPELAAQRDKLLGEADTKVRNGLVKLAEKFPQIKKSGPNYWGELGKPSEAGRISILVMYPNQGKLPRPLVPVPPEERVGVVVVIQPARNEVTQMLMFPIYPKLGLEGTYSMSAGNAELEGALKALVEEALKPLGELDKGGSVKVEEPAWGEAVEGVQVRLVADKVQWKMGEIPTFKAQVRNEGKRQLAIWPIMGRNTAELEVDGIAYLYAGPEYSASAAPFGPGAHFENISIALDPELWIGAKDAKLALAAGKHTVHVAFKALLVGVKDAKPLRAVSNAVEIEVVGGKGDAKAAEPSKGQEEKVAAAQAQVKEAQDRLDEVRKRFAAGQAIRDEVIVAEFGLRFAQLRLEKEVRWGAADKVISDLSLELAMAKVQAAQAGLALARAQMEAGQATKEEVKEQELELSKAQAALAELKTAQSADAARGQGAAGQVTDKDLATMAGEADRIVVGAKWMEVASTNGPPEPMRKVRPDMMYTTGKVLKGDEEPGMFEEVNLAGGEEILPNEAGKTWILFLREKSDGVGVPEYSAVRAKGWFVADSPEMEKKVAEAIPLPTEWGKEVNGLVMGLRLRKGEFKAGEEVAVEICIKNVGKTEVTILQHRFNDHDYYPDTTFELNAGNSWKAGKLVAAFTESSRGRRALKPGEVYIHTARLEKWPVYMMSRRAAETWTAKTAGDVFANAGAVKVTCTYEAKEFKPMWAGTLVSNTVTVQMGNRAEAWGKELKGLRCRWIAMVGAVAAGTAPEVSMEVENVSDKEIFYGVYGAWVVVKEIAPTDKIVPDFKSEAVKGARVATIKEAEKEEGFKIWGPKKKDELMLGKYWLEPGGRVKLTATLPWKLEKTGQYHVMCGISRINPMVHLGGMTEVPPTETEMTCPALVVQVVEAADKAVAEGPRFGVYLVKDAGTELGAVENKWIGGLTLEEKPLITEDDITSYDWKRHTITLKKGMSVMSKHTSIKYFVVTAEGERVYVGAFVSPISSYAPRVPVVALEIGGKLGKEMHTEPPPFVLKGNGNPREDERIRKVMERLGKLAAWPTVVSDLSKLLLLAPPASVPAPIGAKAAEWGEAVEGLRGRLVVKTPIVETAGAAGIESWIELENVGKESRWIMSPEGGALELRVKTKDGKEVAATTYRVDQLVATPKWVEIKAGERGTAPISGEKIAEDVKVEAGKSMGILDIVTRIWRLPVGEYTVTATYASERWDNTDRAPIGAWHGKMELPGVKVEVREKKAEALPEKR